MDNIKNLHESLQNLAKKVNVRETLIDNKLIEVSELANTLSDYATELLFEICLIKLGISDDEI